MKYLITSSLFALSTASLALSICQGEDGELAKLQEDATAKLAAVGYVVPDKVAMERRPIESVIEDLDSIQDEAFLASQFWLFRSLGLEVASTPEAFRRAVVESMAQSLAAYYHAPRKSFVMLDTSVGQISEVLNGGLEPLTVHELVHACQDTREVGVLDLFKAAKSLDEFLVNRCVLEGEAEMVSLAALQGLPALELSSASDFDLGDLERSLSGVGTALIYKSARKWAHHRFQAGGIEALQLGYFKPPTSTEQIMHPTKLGVDLPTVVELPAFGSRFTKVLSETVGELQIHSLLAAAGANRRESVEASIGWDGDMFVLLQVGDSENETAALWRTIWDRDEDAQQFEAALKGVLPSHLETTSHIERSGRSVEFASSQDSAILVELSELLKADPFGMALVKSDAASTAAIEQAALADLPNSKLEEDNWILQKYGMSIPIPDGWVLVKIQGMDILQGPIEAGSNFRTNLNVIAIPNPGGIGLDQHLKLNREGLSSIDGIKLDHIELSSLGDVPALRFEYYGLFPGTHQRLHFLGALYLNGNQQIGVTLTTNQIDWDSKEDALLKVMDDITVEQP
ncbi:MAG: hypothetical protein GY930_10125 [bacterium]|nr:hypothetical protein [bacterium]